MPHISVRSAIAALALCFLFAPPASASPESLRLDAAGNADLNALKYDDALTKFRQAQQLDPADSTAVFLEGVALNRLSRFSEANARLLKAAEMGEKYPELPYETARSYLGMGQWSQALAILEQFDRDHPGRGETAEFIGRCYLGLHEYAKAQASMNEAVRRDPKLKPVVDGLLAGIPAAGAPGAPGRERRTAIPQSETGILLRQRLGLSGPLTSGAIPSGKAWAVNLSLAGGYDSNVTALGEPVVRLPGGPRKESPFIRLSLGAVYDWSISDSDEMVVGYNFLSTIYQGQVSDFNLLDHYAYGEYAHDLADRLTGVLRMSDEFSQIGGENFRNQFVARPSLSYGLASWAETEVAYTFANSEFPIDFVLPQFNESGNSHTLAVTQYFYPSNTNIELRVGYFHTWNNARGSDFDYQSDGILAGAAAPLFWKIVGQVVYTHTWDRYSHLNTLAPSPTGFGFGFRRDDEVDILSAQLARPIGRHASVFVQYDYTNEASNIDFYRFVQQAVSAGVTWGW